MKKAKEVTEEKPKKQRKHTKLKLPKPMNPPKQPSLCDICGEVFKNNTSMLYHKKNKHLMKPVKCPDCPKSSRLYSKYCLNQHIRRVHGEKIFICDTCERRFTLKRSLATHIIKVHSKLNRPDKKYACEKCSKNFTNAKSLTVHERSAHTGNKKILPTSR